MSVTNKQDFIGQFGTGASKNKPYLYEGEIDAEPSMLDRIKNFGTDAYSAADDVTGGALTKTGDFVSGKWDELGDYYNNMNDKERSRFAYQASKGLQDLIPNKAEQDYNRLALVRENLFGNKSTPIKQREGLDDRLYKLNLASQSDKDNDYYRRVMEQYMKKGMSPEEIKNFESVIDGAASNK